MRITSMILLGGMVTKAFELLIFKCVLQPSEIAALQKYLSADEYCIINIRGEKMTYGIMSEELHSRFLDILSGETLECLEYLDENDLRKLREVGDQEIIGNANLLNNLSI